MAKKHHVVRHPSTPPERPRNRLLAALPLDVLQRLLPYLTTVTLGRREVLQRQGDRLRYVYFPDGGVVSLATVLADGTTAEAATVGDDGVVGIETFFVDEAVAPCDSVVQIPGATAARLRVDDFRRALAEYPAFRGVVARYALKLHSQMTRLTACNALHDVQQRCARWILMADDHMHGQPLHLSHEFLAVMLGVRRPTVSVVARMLQAAGCIRYSHGRITVVSRAGLEAVSCDCYRAIRALSPRDVSQS